MLGALHLPEDQEIFSILCSPNLWGPASKKKRGKKKERKEMDAVWPLSLLQQAFSQASSLLYKVELLITRGQEERWCFLFVGVQLFCQLLAQLGHHSFSGQNKKHLQQPGWKQASLKVVSTLGFHITLSWTVDGSLTFWCRSLLQADQARSR